MRQMPPWHVDRTVGIRKFKDDPTFYTMSDEEFKTEVAERNAKKNRATAAQQRACRCRGARADRTTVGPAGTARADPLRHRSERRSCLRRLGTHRIARHLRSARVRTSESLSPLRTLP
jgi:hypothetical protein